jgi:transposase-like protein
MSTATKGPEPKFVRQMTLAEFDRLFPDEPSCWIYLLLQRSPEGPHCPRCNNDHVYESTARPWHWQCKKCGKDNRSPYRFSLKTKTTFEETKLPLRTWFKVLHLMLTSKKGISALQIHRMLGTGSYRWAWYVCQRLRAAMQDPDFQKFMGIVEVDEAYIGRKDKNRHWSKKSRQQREAKGTDEFGDKIGYGIGWRDWRNRAQGQRRLPDHWATDARTLAGFVRNAVNEKVSLVATDENQGYNTLDTVSSLVERSNVSERDLTNSSPRLKWAMASAFADRAMAALPALRQ